MRKIANIALATVLFLSLAASLVIPWSATAEETGVLIIVSKDFDGDSISREEVKKIFLGKSTKTSKGSTTLPVIMKDGSAHETFLREFIKKNSSQFKSYWRNMVFSGEGIAPKEASNDAEMIEFVAANSGAIGYSAGTVGDERVKVLKVE